MQSSTRRILCEAFPVVRSLTTAEGMNEVLVAGERVATRRALDPYDDAFNDWRDRMFWNRIKLLRLQ